MSTIHLTSLQAEVLQVLANMQTDQRKLPCDAHIANRGKMAYGRQWVGGRRTQHHVYPILNRTLGLLKSKGLVEAVSGTDSPEGFSLWTLSDLGCDVMGIAPSSSL